MGRNYHYNDKEFHANMKSVDFLDRIFFGLFEKISSVPKTIDDCKLMVRILRNRVHWNQYWEPYALELWNIEKLNNEAIDWMLDGAFFFESIKDINKLKIS